MHAVAVVCDQGGIWGSLQEVAEKQTKIHASQRDLQEHTANDLRYAKWRFTEKQSLCLLHAELKEKLSGFQCFSRLSGVSDKQRE